MASPRPRIPVSSPRNTQSIVRLGLADRSAQETPEITCRSSGAYAARMCGLRRADARTYGAAALRTPGQFQTTPRWMWSPPGAAAKRVERLARMTDFVDAVGVVRRFRVLRAEVRLHRRNPHARRSRRRRRACDEQVTERRPIEFLRDVVLPAAGGPGGVRHLPRGLLEIRPQPSPLEHLRNTFETPSQAMCAPPVERPSRRRTRSARGVELVRALGADRGRVHGARLTDRAQELVQKEAPPPTSPTGSSARTARLSPSPEDS